MRVVALLLAAVTLAAHAQPAPKVHRVAFVASTSPVSELLTFNPAARGFADGLRERGYVEGKNVHIDWRSAEGRFERFPEIMRELVSAKVEVIVTVTNPMTKAAKDATRTIPIVMAASTIPVEDGLITSLARPGGNVTGLTLDAGPEILGKRLQLLRELLPHANRVAVLGFESGLEWWAREQAEGRATNTNLIFLEPGPTKYAESFSAIARERPDALLVAASAANYGNRRLIAQLAAKHGVPAVYPARDYVFDADGLMSYGPDIRDIFHRAAGYVDRILKGAKPADLPVERPTRFELVINLKAAKAIGMSISNSLLIQADHIVQ
jgi:putative ABC transport system substrate-binding protein